MPRWFAFVFWVVLCAIGFGAPIPSRPDQTAWLVDLTLLRWSGENPLVAAHFALMGVWPLLAVLLLADRWRARPIPAWPFLLGSMAMGCFVLLPWFWLSPRASAGPPAPAWARGPVAPAFLGIAALGLVVWALIFGDYAAYGAAVTGDSFVWAMAWDFLAFMLMFTLEARSRADESRVPWPVTLIPLFGAAAWLGGQRAGANPT